METVLVPGYVRVRVGVFIEMLTVLWNVDAPATVRLPETDKFEAKLRGVPEILRALDDN
jgi:hypothetical protein